MADNKDFEENTVDNDIIHSQEFSDRYTDLQDKWLNGFRKKEEITTQEKEKYGQHSYLLKFVNQESEAKPDNVVFHPSYTFSYTEYDKTKVLEKMTDANKLKKMESDFQSHIDRFEKEIFSDLLKRETEKAKERQELEDKKDEENDETMKEKKEIEEKKSKEKGGWVVPPFCIPIRADIREFDFVKLAQKQKELSGRLFDVIQMDPPWQLASANPTRGVALGYSQLGDDIISNIPVPSLQENGLIFVWVINAKYRLALQLFEVWGYSMIADVAWVKQTVNRRIANGHGFYLQHAKETCLIGLKGDLDKIPLNVNLNKIRGICSDVIYSERRGQSQKPEEIYQYIEQLVPEGNCLEIFARRNNLRNGWVSIGNEL